MERYPQRARDVTSKSIDGISDLVVWAPIKDGFIDAFSNVTYETRLRQVAEALHRVRVSAREYETLEPFPDTAKRILSLLDFRIGIVDRDLFEKDQPGRRGNGDYRPQRYMYLVATFDGPWEPYMRLIWHPLGSFLDLVLCNCEGYKLAMENDFETYAQWVRDHQLDSAIFYSTSGLTVTDKIYLSELERIQRETEPDDSDKIIAGLSIPHPDEAARRVRNKMCVDSLRLALEAINVLYKLTDYFPADTFDDENGDAHLLHRATHSLLGNYCFEDLRKTVVADDPHPQTGDDAQPFELAKKIFGMVEHLYKEPLDWYEQSDCPDDTKKEIKVEPDPPLGAEQIQKGLLTSYDDDLIVSHGALLLLRVNDMEKAKEFIRLIDWSWESPGSAPPISKRFDTRFWDRMYRNILFTYEGLKRFGLAEERRKEFPEEFRQGMADRAPMLGEKYANHPRHWKLPKRNWMIDGPPEGPPVELSEVDFAIHVRCGATAQSENEQMPNTFAPFVDEARAVVSESSLVGVEEFYGVFATQYATALLESVSEEEPQPGAFDWLLADFLSKNKDIRSPIVVFVGFIHYLGERYGFSILSVEPMFRPDPETRATLGKTSIANAVTTRDHFSFRDGISQPVITSSQADPDRLSPSQVYAGDVVCGYRNTRGDVHRDWMQDSLLFNGSFVAVRKISQNVPEFMDFIDNEPALKGGAKLVGRDQDGNPLVNKPLPDNNFTFEGDTKGQNCPLTAHIRMSNPRGTENGRKHPMVLRRGMSYGNRYRKPTETDPGNADEPRGIMFMAFCASLAEQYEIIQRWLNAGNPTNVSSSQNDPLTGVMPPNGKQTFRFLDDAGAVQRFEISKAFTGLEWGHYFFCPSKNALREITQEHRKPGLHVPRIEEGEAVIREIERLPKHRQQEEWKRILEDFLTKDPTQHDIAPRIWEAIQVRGGAYRVESGIAYDEGGPEAEQPVIIVTDPDLIHDVFQNKCEDTLSGGPVDTCPYSSKEQNRRIEEQNGGFGTIYVGLDAPCRSLGINTFKVSRYFKEAYPTNDFLMKYTLEAAIDAGYAAGKEALKAQKKVAEDLAQMREGAPGFKGKATREFKLELGRQYIQPALALLCRGWFGIPDTEYILSGGWNWNNPRTPVCPGDFLSPSRHAFYPRPTTAITKYGLRHGSALRAAVRSYVSANWDKPERMNGAIAKDMHDAIWKKADAATSEDEKKYYQELLGRNLIGIMIGALPPMDANLRFALFEWLDSKTLWHHQDRFRRNKLWGEVPGLRDVAKEVLMGPLSEAMCIRPAPDLIYRTVDHDTVRIGNVIANKGEMVILCLPGATQAALKQGNPDVKLIFGGNRKDEDGNPARDHPLHACPAQDMAMGGMIGILTALLNAGRIQALPASLIVRISDWDEIPPIEPPQPA